MLKIHSKLPNLGTTIFTQMSALAQEVGAINLSQGFPNFDCDARLQGLVAKYIAAGKNQYAPMAGVAELTQRLSQKIAKLYGQTYDARTEITITAGATQAIYTAITAFVQAGDEVVMIEPAYDCYRPAVELCGGTVRPYALRADENWRIDWQKFALLLNERTRLVIINTPNNPSASLLLDADMRALAALLKGTNILLLSDEVYEHLTFEGQPHCSALSYEELRERTLATYSFGKTLHATGWKMGYIVGAERLMQEFRKVHQFNVFCVNAPMQYAIAEYLEDENTYLTLPDFFQKKRDFFRRCVGDTLPFKWLPCAGTYFQIADYSAVSEERDTDFAIRLTREAGVALIPLSVFYTQVPENQRLLRICFAKNEDTLSHAAAKLAAYFALIKN